MSEQQTEAGVDAAAGEEATAGVAEGATVGPSEPHLASKMPDGDEPKAHAGEAPAGAGSPPSDRTATFGKLMIMAPHERHKNLIRLISSPTQLPPRGAKRRGYRNVGDCRGTGNG